MRCLTGLGYPVETYLLTNVSASNCASSVLTELRAGLPSVRYDVWVAGGQQYAGCMTEVFNEVDKDPQLGDLKVLHLAGANPRNRVTVITPSMHEVRFLHGLLCAQATKTQKVGFVIGLPRTNTVLSRSLNAYVLGVKSWDPGIEVLVGITGSFLDPVAERKATEILLKAGVGCITQQQNDLTVNSIANAADIWSIGYTTDARVFTGSSKVLSSMDLFWANSLIETTRSILNGHWEPCGYIEIGYANNSIALTSYSPLVEPGWRGPIEDWIKQFKQGHVNLFCTPNFTDPKYMGVANWTEISSNNETCLNQLGISKMLGVIDSATVLVEFNELNSPFTLVYVEWKSPGVIFFIIFVALLIIASIGSMVDVAFNRRSPIYRASSPLFCFLILIGVTITACAPLFMIGKRTKCSCMAPWWTLGIGYAIIFSCLMAKNWRIWRIFASGRFKVVAIMNTQLLWRWVGGILGLELLILILWTALDPRLPTTSRNPELAYDQLQLMCASKSGTSAGITTFMAYNVAILLPLAFISWRTRHAKEEYRESRAIGMTVLTAAVVDLTVIGVLVALTDDYQTFFYMFSFGSCLILLVVLCTLFLPKIWRIHFPSSGISSPNTDTSQGVSYLQSQVAPQSMTGFESRPSYTAGSLTDRSRRSRDGNRSREAPATPHVAPILPPNGRPILHPNHDNAAN